MADDNPILGYYEGKPEENWITISESINKLPTNSEEPYILEFLSGFTFPVECMVCDKKAVFCCACDDNLEPFCAEHRDKHAYDSVEIAPEKQPQELKGFNRKDRTKDGKKKFYY